MCLVTVLTLVATSYVDWDKANRQRDEELYPGAFVVQRDGEFLNWVNRPDKSDRTVPVISLEWTPDPAEAWRFATKDSALEQAVQLGGIPRRLKEVYP